MKPSEVLSLIDDLAKRGYSVSEVSSGDFKISLAPITTKSTQAKPLSNKEIEEDMEKNLFYSSS